MREEPSFTVEGCGKRPRSPELSKDELIRKLMLGKMQRREYSNDRNEAIRAWVCERPEIKTKIEERARNVPEQDRERASLNAARTEVMDQTARRNGVRP